MQTSRDAAHQLSIPRFSSHKDLRHCPALPVLWELWRGAIALLGFDRAKERAWAKGASQKRALHLHRLAMTITFALLGVSTNHVSAAEVAKAYKGVVTSAWGAHASSFSTGQEIAFSYVLDTTPSDFDPIVGTGRYRE